MSLINDALKKAQRQRSEGSAPATETSTPTDSQEPLHRVARRAKPAGFRSQLILVAGGVAAAVILLGVGAFFLFRPAAETPAPASPHPAKIASASTPAPAAATPVEPATATATVSPAAPNAAPANVPQPAPTVVAASTPPPAAPAETTPAPAPVATTTPATTSPASAPVSFSIPTPPATASTPAATAAPSAPATASASAERPKPSTRMIGVIEHMKVGGIRVAGAESKVLMNDRVYRINDIIDFELGIRLTAIEAKALTFEDSRGAIHVRTF